MCQNYGHSDSTFDLIINRTVLLTAQLPVRCREEKADAERRDFKVIACESSDGMQKVCVCVRAEMDAHQSVFRWG